MQYLQANRRCVQCKESYEPTTDEPDFLVATASEMLCPTCKEIYAAELMTVALERSVQKLYQLQERRGKQ